MWDRIRSSLKRQHKGLQVLHALLKEEFSLLVQRHPHDVHSVEFSIHELLRQMAVEREEVKKLLGGQRLKAKLKEHPDPMTVKEFEIQLQLLDDAEQTCARQASLNCEMVMALRSQSKELLDYLHRQLQPKKMDVYGKKGRFTMPRPEASLLSGRL